MYILFLLVAILLILMISVGLKQMIGAEEDTYPYLSRYVPLKDIVARTRNLKDYKFEFAEIDPELRQVHMFEMEKYYLPMQKKCIKVKYPDYNEKYEDIADWFNEPCRVRANVLDSPSVYEWWLEEGHNIMKKCNNDLHAAREYTYIHDSKDHKHLTNFKPTNLAGIIDMYGSTRILDFSSGWGDRLAAAMGKEVDRYVGVDPNPCLHPNYARMIEALNVSTDVTMIESPFETADIGNEMFDLVFTSPPYFALEVYSGDNGQSIEHGSLIDWYEKFLMVSIKKSWEHLSVGGILGVNINDYGYRRYVQKMEKDVSLFPDSEYHGVIFYSTELVDGRYVTPNPQPIFIWKKVEKCPIPHIRQVANVRPIVVADKITDEYEGYSLFDWKSYGGNVILRSDFEPAYTDKNVNGFRVISDSDIPGGLRRRALFNYMIDHPEYEEYVYYGTAADSTHASIAYAGSCLDKKITCYTSSSTITDKNTKMLKDAESYWASVNIVNGNMEKTYEEMKKYAKDKGIATCVIDNDLGNIRDYFINSIRDMVPSGSTLWVACTSQQILMCFAEALSDAHICAVQVGGRLTEIPGVSVYVASEKYNERAKIIPPYRSYLQCDGKVWGIAKKYGKSGDYILNSC